MAQTSAYGIRSVDLAVRDLDASKAFYEAQWGLREVSRYAVLNANYIYDLPFGRGRAIGGNVNRWSMHFWEAGRSLAS